MPPAFNLSQDQTLQFNPLQVTQSTLAPTRPNFRSDKPGLRTQLFSQARLLHRVSTKNFSIPQPNKPSDKRPITYPAKASKAPAPTPIGCSFLKNGTARTHSLFGP